MLRITVPATEWYDEAKNEFISVPETTLQLEHSLIALSKWESKWKKPWFRLNPRRDKRTFEEDIDYIRCMTINSNVDPLVYGALTNDLMKRIWDYVDDPMTATTIGADRGKKEGASPMRRNAQTAETIYSLMIENGIPFECQKWHLNRLFTLIRVCQVRNTKPQKNGKVSNEHLLSRAQLNAQRRAQMKSKG